MKLTDKNLSKKILDGLREECKVIPEKGFMAGGAVANTIFSIFWGDKPYPINDIDIFYETKRASTPFYSWDTVHTPMRSDSLTIVGDGYDVTKCVYDSNVTYKVLTTRRDGLINFIEISTISDRDRDYMYILKGYRLSIRTICYLKQRCRIHSQWNSSGHQNPIACHLFQGRPI